MTPSDGSGAGRGGAARPVVAISVAGVVAVLTFRPAAVPDDNLKVRGGAAESVSALGSEIGSFR